MKITLFSVFTFFCFYFLHAQSPSGTVRVLFSPDHPANKFIPSQSLGAAFDGHTKGDIDLMLTKENIKAMQTVGLRPLSYRLRTELGGDVWHWNPEGKWSEPQKHQGYWVSSDHSSLPIELCYGYRLPRRGNTIDQANDDGYSRLADGNETSFWKSNPYLDEYFTKESDTLHPQWIIADLGKLYDVNAVRIKWSQPYALTYKVDYALDIGSDYFEPFQPYLWHPFPNNIIENTKGENKIISVSKKPIKVRFVRIMMTKSSFTQMQPSSDVRDKLGFAIFEFQAGFLDAKGDFHDWIRHFPEHKKQSTMYVSSTDPWHRASDLDPMIEQSGIDRFFTCGITNSLPAMIPSGLLYDTPENAESLARYIQKKRYPVQEIEMGEEPEGQLISPVDYGALYCQWAKRIKKVIPDIHLGGPSFATLAFTRDDTETFSESKWTSIFLDYLKRHNSLELFNFFSFEWYPFDDVCKPSAPQLAIAPQMLDIALKNIYNNILPPHTPIYLTEYGYSAFGGRSEVEIEAALMYADILGKFMTMGGDKSFLYGYEPAYLEQTNGCDFGNNMLFGLDKDGKILYKTAAYYGIQMLTHLWAVPQDSMVEIFPAVCNIMNQKDQPLITAYSILKPDGKWSVALVNKDPLKTHNVKIVIENTVSKQNTMLHPAQLTQYSKEQYHWINNGSKGHPSLDLPPVEKALDKTSNISLPPYSLTVITE